MSPTGRSWLDGGTTSRIRLSWRLLPERRAGSSPSRQARPASGQLVDARIARSRVVAQTVGSVRDPCQGVAAGLKAVLPVHDDQTSVFGPIVDNLVRVVVGDVAQDSLQYRVGDALWGCGSQ